MSTRDGDFEAFVVARGQALADLAMRLTGDRGWAEDAVQDVLSRVYLRWPRIEGDPFSYSRQAVVHECSSVVRRLLRRRRLVDEELVDPERLTGLAGGSDEASRDLHLDIIRSLRELPLRQRVVLVLKYVEDMSDADIASLLGCRVGTVKSQTSKALARIRSSRMLSDYAREGESYEART